MKISSETRAESEDSNPFAGRWAAGGGMGELVSAGSQPSDEEALKPERAKGSYVIQRGRDGIMEEGDY